ncbi:SRPBCC family protein [Micromonospora sp. NPDC047793]|uniref:SRPBCC family protein n=1 Tax=unclassified Micromonospora TaxID=2617518 RepID=UPI00103304CE|nr:SRPBCC family protein [Verrucosispora sp. SN26_14.1]TBL42092.1 SRPBCC family protein [Verrucosispora sp. SN26_14.1]
MPVVEAVAVVPVPPNLAFAISQTTMPVRRRWDPFVRSQHFVDGAVRPDKGVRTFTRSRHGFSMVSEYVSYAPPTTVGMKMVRGPWFFEMFAGGWRFAPAAEPGHSVATWRYHFRCRPALLRPVADRIGTWLLGRDIRRRIAGYAAGCADPVVVAAAERDLRERGDGNRTNP